MSSNAPLDFDFEYGCRKYVHMRRHVGSGGGRGGKLPPQILADQKGPPGSGGAPHYYLPPQIFRLCNMPVWDTLGTINTAGQKLLFLKK